MPSAHLLLLEEHAGAGAHLALDALPGLVVRHHRLLQLVLGLQSTRNRINQPIKADITTSRSHPSPGTHQRDQVVALRGRQEPLVEERPNRHTEPHSGQTRARHSGFGRRAEQSGREIGSSPGAPRELDHAGGVEGAGAPARRGGGGKAAGEEERDRGGEEEVAVESHGVAPRDGRRRGNLAGEDEAAGVPGADATGEYH